MKFYSRYILSISFLSLCVFSYTTAQDVGKKVVIGQWEIKGDSMITWIRNHESDLTISFTYEPPVLMHSTNPRVRFTFIDSSFTAKDAEDLDVLNIEHRFSTSEWFDVISRSVESSFKGFAGSLEYQSVHEVICMKNSTTDEITYEFYNGNFKKQTYKYTINSKGIGEAIKHIACKGQIK